MTRTRSPCITPSAAAVTFQRASGPPRADPHSPSVCPGLARECASLANSLSIWMLLWGAYLETHCIPQHWGWVLSFSLYRSGSSPQISADHRIQPARPTQEERAQADCWLSRTWLSSAGGINHCGAWGRLPQDTVSPLYPLHVHPWLWSLWMWTASCSSSLCIRTWGPPWWLRGKESACQCGRRRFNP